jgi:hypothetical protein
MSQTSIRIIIGLFVGVIALIALVTGRSIDREGYKWISGAALAVSLLVVAYHRWVWRWPWVRKIAHWRKHPLLVGTWKGTLDYERDAHGNPGLIPIYFRFDQTLTQVEVHGYVSSSESHSLTASITHPSRAEVLLSFVYRSAAPSAKQTTNRPHLGAAVLKLINSPVTQIHGDYWTDRGGVGQIHLTEFSKARYGSFEQAEHGSYARL